MTAVPATTTNIESGADRVKLRARTTNPEVVGMLPKPIWPYFLFGYAARYLATAHEDYPVFDQGTGPETHVLTNIKRVFEFMEELQLTVTANTLAAERLQEIKEKLITLQQDATLTAEDTRAIRKNMAALQHTLRAELKGINAFVVTPKVLDTDKLLNAVSTLLAPGVYAAIPEIARFDLTEAGRCIAFELATAAAFHLLRGTESVLREFYCRLVKNKRVKPMLWGPMVSQLQRRRSGTPHTDLLHHLDHIRVSFRNPTQHPEKLYDIHEAQDLWSLCVDSINRMAKALT